MLIHDTAYTMGNIGAEVQSNLYDMKLRWYTTDDVNTTLQEQYNKIVALLCPISRSTFIPMISEPYYQLFPQVPDFMYLSGLFNPNTNLWLEGLTYKQMKAIYQTYLAVGQPRWHNIVDMTRLLIWPYLPGATGVLYLLYKASAPVISDAHVPILPYSVGPKILEYMTTMDLLEQKREFTKATKWFNKVYKATPSGKSLWEQCKSEIYDLARNDRERVLEPYRWIFHGGNFVGDMWISNETPGGTIDGLNSVFTIAKVPNPTSSLLIMKNGQIMFNGEAYNLNGQSIAFNSNFVPQSSDVLRAWYQVS